jgi:hypothetical protein
MRIGNWLVGAAFGLLVPAAALAMGYDSLACPELAERRIEYFTNNGFCDPAKADAKDCKKIEAGAEAQLPAGDRTQVEMIVKVEARKSCPAK